MSYVRLNPSYYQMLQPESPWHPGGQGWSTAPVPGWGENPALVGPARLAVEGLGADDAAAALCSNDRAKGVTYGVAFGAVLGGITVFLLLKT